MPGLIGGVGVNSVTTDTPLTQASLGNGASAAQVKVSGNVNVTSQSQDSRHRHVLGGQLWSGRPGDCHCDRVSAAYRDSVRRQKHHCQQQRGW